MLDKRICRIHSFGEKAEVLQFILKVAISNVEIFHVLLRQPVCSEMVKLFQLVLGILKMKSIFSNEGCLHQYVMGRSSPTILLLTMKPTIHNAHMKIPQFLALPIFTAPIPFFATFFPYDADHKYK